MIDILVNHVFVFIFFNYRRRGYDDKERDATRVICYTICYTCDQPIHTNVKHAKTLQQSEHILLCKFYIISRPRTKEITICLTEILLIRRDLSLFIELNYY